MYPNLEVSGSVVHEPETGRDLGFSTAHELEESQLWHLPFPFVGSCCREIVIWRYQTSHVQGNQKQIPLPMEPKTSWVDHGRSAGIERDPISTSFVAGGTWQAFMAWVPTGSSMQNPEPWSLAQLGCHGFDGYHSWNMLNNAEPNNKASPKSSWIVLINQSWKAVSIGVSSRLFSGPQWQVATAVTGHDCTMWIPKKKVRVKTTCSQELSSRCSAVFPVLLLDLSWYHITIYIYICVCDWYPQNVSPSHFLKPRKPLPQGEIAQANPSPPAKGGRQVTPWMGNWVV